MMRLFHHIIHMPGVRISTNTKDHIPEEEEAKDILCLQVTQIVIQYILDYPVKLGNLFPKSWPDKHLAG